MAMRPTLRKLSSIFTMASSIETKSKVSVVIVGGGASGLQCASSLLQDSAENEKPSLLILEARDRLGGRVCTAQETRHTVHDEGSPSREVIFSRDHGACRSSPPHVKLGALLLLETDVVAELLYFLLIFSLGTWHRLQR
jgi:hypothetical protein